MEGSSELPKRPSQIQGLQGQVLAAAALAEALLVGLHELDHFVVELHHVLVDRRGDGQQGADILLQDILPVGTHELLEALGWLGHGLAQ
eukprot:4850026-Alexandrium_andersonii.AAC.1